MTVLWRVSRHRNLDGLGGLRAPGRWHGRGSPVVYLAETPAGALLEACVHTAATDVPPGYTLLEIAVPAATSMEAVAAKSLSPGWPQNIEETRAIGSQWLQSMKSALLRVPSVLVPATHNVLLNPGHPDARHIEISRVLEYPFDARLKR